MGANYIPEEELNSMVTNWIWKSEVETNVKGDSHFWLKKLSDGITYWNMKYPNWDSLEGGGRSWFILDISFNFQEIVISCIGM